MGRVIVPIAAALLAMVSVQTGASIAKTLFPLIGAVGTVALRIGFGTLVLVIALRPWRTRISRTNWQPLAVYGVSIGVMNLCFYLALSRIPLGIAVALEFTGPLAVAVFASHRPLDFLWIGLAVAGLGLILPLTHTGHAVNLTGALFALGAGACWALYIVFGRRTGADHGTQSVALGSLISAVIIVPAGVLSAPPALFSHSVLLFGLAVGILSTALPYALDMVALTRLPPRTFGVLMSLDPAVGALCGWVLLGEQLTPLQWTAVVLIILASAGSASTIHGVPAAAPVPD
ncbi:MAG TPA: threonine/homoserine exporter RhtA [Steroidobacteraceae bacterium]|nr:threonine/homoserine exporter RhtA [Steroidobacteraceae bacterium]